MQTTSSTYNSLLSANARRQIRAKFEGVTDYYGEEAIISCGTSSALFAEGTMGLGGCVAKKLNMRFYPGTNRTNIPRMASAKLQLRLTNGTTNSEWKEKGTYYIDTRKYDALTGIMEIEAYDAMLKGEVNFLPSTDTSSPWPRTMSAVLSECATRLGVSLDSRNVITDYNVQLPMGMSIRQVLGYIASANGGNFVITDDDKLRLVRYVDSTADTVALGKNCSSFNVGEAFQNITRITINTGVNSSGEVEYYTAGNDTGMTLEIENPWGTQAMANTLQGIFSAAGVFNYLPFESENATLNPATELGDFVTINGTTVMLCTRDIEFDGLCCMTIQAPSNEEIDHEYPYQSAMERLQQDIQSKVSAGDIASTINQTAQSVLIQASKIDLSGYATFSSLSTAGATVINGSNITTGTINASLIDTSSLRVEEVYYKSGSTYYRIVHGEAEGSDIAAVFGLQNMSNSVVSLMGNSIQFLDGINTTAKGIEIQMPSKTIDFWPSGDWVLGSNARSINGAFFDYVYLVTTTTAHGLLYASGNHLYYEDPSGTRHTIV